MIRRQDRRASIDREGYGLSEDELRQYVQNSLRTYADLGTLSRKDLVWLGVEYGLSETELENILDNTDGNPAIRGLSGTDLRSAQSPESSAMFVLTPS